MNSATYSKALQAEIFATVDEEQRRAADPNASVWVAASAGTGKTKVLTDRVLRLLLAGSSPAEILCLTYTRAAAAEMSNRLYRRLAAWATLPTQAEGDAPSLTRELHALGLDPRERDFARARQLFTLVLDCAGGMRIQTIHAFCQSILARFPLEAGLPPGFTVLDERAAGALAQQSFERMLGHVAAGPDTPFAQALLRLLSLIGESALRKLLTRDVLGSRVALTAHPLDETCNELEAALELAQGQGEQTDAAIIEQALATAEWSYLKTVCIACADGTISDQKFSAKIASILQQQDAGQPLQWDDYASIFLTDKGTVRAKPLTKKVAEANPELLATFYKIADLILETEALRAKARLYRTNRDLYIVAESWLKRIEREKRREAALDYTDLINNARLLLKNTRRAWVQYKLDTQLHHVLLDEAQDTSDPQWQIVQSLTEEFFTGEGATESLRTLFVVGDEKQSIYSFNGADPAAFAQARADYKTSAEQAGIAWADVPLSLSFRSTGAVLDFVNRVFADEVTRQHISREAFQQSPARLGEAGLVEVWRPLLKEQGQGSEPWALPLERRPQQTPSVKLAEQIATRIKQWLDTGEVLQSNGRAIRAGDIMVLVPRRTAFFPQLVRALKNRNIPVAGVDRLVLTSQLAVQDILALCKFILLPEDDLTLATLLKTPFIGLSEENLFALCHERRGSVWQALSERRLQPNFTAAVEWLERWRARVDFRRPHELLQEVLAAPCPAYDARQEGIAGREAAAVSGREALWRRLGPDALDPIDELLAEAIAFEEREAATLQHFLEWITATEIEKKRELTGTTDEVRIMTAHAAKGLEAPIVFVVDLPRKNFPVPTLLADPDSDSPLLYVPPDSKAEAITLARKTAAQAAQQAESLRLLYVALTRAEDRLYFCGAYGDSIPQTAWHWAVLPAAESLGQAVEQGWRYETAQTKPLPAQKIMRQITEPILPEWVHQPAPPEPTLARPLSPSQASAPVVRTQSPAAPNATRRFLRGELTHKLLQYLPELSVERREEAASAWLARQQAPEDLCLSVKDEVLRLLCHPDFAPLFGPGSMAEVPLVGIVGGTVVSGQVDRLLITDEAILFVDYKTNRPPPEALEGVPEGYGRQLALYAALLRQVYPNRTVRAALLWTDGPRLMELPENWLDGFLMETPLQNP